jgi:NAD-dependent dihydropyrimidine dehydrogenase PreA subunit
MIEVIDSQRCTGCNICVHACPPNVFDATGDVPIIARQQDCQTCFMCEAWCPEDALYVSPHAEAPEIVDLVALQASETLGSYRHALGWSKDRIERAPVAL